MMTFFFLVGLLQGALLWFLGRVGIRLNHVAKQEWAQARFDPPNGWPRCAMAIPVGSVGPRTESALRSLATQNYPDYTMYLVTASANEEAAVLSGAMARDFPHVKHVVAGFATVNGQKNHNQLAAIRAIGDSADILAFCDSTHLARPDFLRSLVGPIARKESAFTTGYHQAQPEGHSLLTLAYCLTVLFMRFLQGIPALAQPWGGAMAMSRSAFVTADVAALWAENVVDDCSLAALLADIGIKVRLCPGALLRTDVKDQSLVGWQDWLTRQILFLKFCIHGQWITLGIVSLCMAIPPAWFIWTCLRGILGVGSGAGPLLALCWFLILAYVMGAWRQFLTSAPPLGRWLASFFMAAFMFLRVFVRTIGRTTLGWNHITYWVGDGGKVIRMEKPMGFENMRIKE